MAENRQGRRAGKRRLKQGASLVEAHGAGVDSMALIDVVRRSRRTRPFRHEH
jgi:hypothetical protein